MFRILVAGVVALLMATPVSSIVGTSFVSVAEAQQKAQKKKVKTATSRGSCCLAQLRQCNAFCATPAGISQGSACGSECSGRMATCTATGRYYWKNRPTAHC